jgi:thiamine biosynthesis lipoprotein
MIRNRAAARAGLLLSALAGSLVLCGCNRTDRVEHGWLAMDTEFSASLYGAHNAGVKARAKVPPDSAFAALERESNRLELLFSDYLPQSALSSLKGRAGDTLRIPAPELAEVLAAAEKAAFESQGIFDVTLHALKEAWGLSSGETGRVPSEEALAAAMRGNPAFHAKAEDHPALFPAFRVLPGNRLVLLRDSVSFDLGGIAKGYAVDRLHALLDTLGYRNHLVMAGGDMRVGGIKPDGPWKIGIRHPRKPDSLAGTLFVGPERAISTSGDYERFFLADGARYHHIFDPRTGRPADPWCSVTVLARESLWADALSEPLFILGPEGGRLLLSRFGVQAIWIRPQGEGLCHVASEGLRKEPGRYVLPGIPECDEPGS